jgi:hypothetical protein
MTFSIIKLSIVFVLMMLCSAAQSKVLQLKINLYLRNYFSATFLANIAVPLNITFYTCTYCILSHVDTQMIVQNSNYSSCML